MIPLLAGNVNEQGILLRLHLTSKCYSALAFAVQDTASRHVSQTSYPFSPPFPVLRLHSQCRVIIKQCMRWKFNDKHKITISTQRIFIFDGIIKLCSHSWFCGASGCSRMTNGYTMNSQTSYGWENGCYCWSLQWELEGSSMKSLSANKSSMQASRWA